VTAMSDLPLSGGGELGGLPIPDRVVLDEGTTLALHRIPEIDAVVVEVSGLAAGSWADSLALELLALGPELRLVIDVCDATLVNPSGLCEVLDEVISAGSDPHRVCVVCERLSAVVLLRRYGATEQVAIFGSAQDAVQAVLHHEEGYGVGWAPSLTI
jgi:hypothetical protein